MVARSIRYLTVLCIGLALSACGGGGSDAQSPKMVVDPNPPPPAPTTKPGVLSISALPRLNPPPATPQETIDRATEAFNLVYNAGARGQYTSFRWSAFEPTKGNYDSKPFSDLNGAITNAANHSMVEFVNIQLINTTNRELPLDMQSLAFNDPAVIAEFHALLDRVLTAANRGKIAYLAIGNEVDVYLGAHPSEWQQYKAFYNDARQYARTLDPNIKVGVTGTADGALIRSPSELADLNAQSDIIILTYYPIQSNGGVTTVKSPSVVLSDFPMMVSFAGVKPLILQEVGYPASPTNASSEAMQAQFVTNVFSAWKLANGKIPFLNYFLLHDFTQQMCDDFGAYYGTGGNTSFKAFLCTLGLRKDDGTPRAAWNTLQSEATLAGLP